MLGSSRRPAPLPAYQPVGSPATAQLLVQAAIVQIYALLSSPASTYF